MINYKFSWNKQNLHKDKKYNNKYNKKYNNKNKIPMGGINSRVQMAEDRIKELEEKNQ